MTKPANSWAEHLRPQLAELQAYDIAPAPPGYARLHANECCEPWPPEVTAAMAEIAAGVELGRYPDTSGRRLRQILARIHGCDPGQLVLGNGSDEVIFIILTALSGHPAGPGAVVMPTPTFVMYRHTAHVLGMPVRGVPLDDVFDLDLPRMHQALRGAAVCFLARPNNPTGTLFSAASVHELVADHPATVFVIDEAYIAYAPEQSLSVADGPSNVVYMHTLSKVGAAALRVGYCLAPHELATAFDKVRHPYNVSATSLAFAECLLTRFTAARDAMVTRVRRNRGRLAAILERTTGAHVFESAANLVLIRLPDPAAPPRLCRFLAERAVLIKDVSSTPGLAGCVRVTVGTDKELDTLELALADY